MKRSAISFIGIFSLMFMTSVWNCYTNPWLNL